MGKINKATVSAVLGAVGTVVAMFVPTLPPEVIVATTAAIMAFFTWLVPNTES
jgi:hypothetical protein